MWCAFCSVSVLLHKVALGPGVTQREVNKSWRAKGKKTVPGACVGMSMRSAS